MDITNHQIKCTSCGELARISPPEDQRRYKLIFGSVFAFFGWIVGSFIGVATAGIGSTASGPLMLVCVYLGIRLSTWYSEKKDGYTCDNCGNRI